MAATRGVTVTASAPGKLILFGEHAVVYGATAIAGALSDLRVHVRASMEPTAAVAISLLRFGEPPGGGGGGGGAYGGDSGSGGGGEGRRDGALPPPPALVVTVAELAAAVAAAAPELRGAREAPPARPPPALVAALGGLLAAAVDTAVARAGEAAAAAAAAGRGDGAAATAATAAAAAPATAADVFGAPAPDVVKAATAPLFLLAAVFAAELATGALPGASVAVTHCTLPVAAGLGSSAALSVAAAAAALGAWAAVAAPPPAAPPSPADANAWAFCAECLFHGAPSGLDNTVSALGGSLAYVRASGGAPARVSPLESLPPLRLLVVNTRVPKNTAALVAGVRALRDAEPRVVDRTLDAVAAVADAVQALVAARAGGGGRAAAGNDRVASGGAGGAEPAADGARAVGASGAAGAAAGTQPLMLEEHAALARLVRLNHGLLVALGVSHPALDAVVAAAGARGWPAKLTGAGGGGCALVLLPPRPAAPGAAADADAAAVAALERELRGAGCAVFATALGGRGLVVEGAGEGAGGAAGE